MGALTPVPCLELADFAQVSPLNVSGLQSLPSPTTSPLPLVAFAPNPSAPGASRNRGSGLRLSVAGSPCGPAESSSLSYGRLLHLPLLPTPPRGDAVTVGYRPEWACLKGTLTLPARHPHGRTSADLQVRIMVREPMSGPGGPRSKRRCHP